MITAIAGGVGAARLLRGLVRVVPPAEVTAVVNTGDDEQFHGLHVSPDVDTVVYTLSGAVNPDTGWGRAGDSFHTLEALERFAPLGVETWFRLGDLDLATHLVRTHRLREGTPLHEVTAEVARAFGVEVRLLPMTDDPAPTVIHTVDPPAAMAMQEWFVRHRCGPEVRAVDLSAAAAARPAPGVLEALEAATTIVVCPSNPIISVGPVLAVPGVREVLARRRDDVVAVSPIVGGAALKGPADRLMRNLGHDASCTGVARLYADVAGTLVIDEVDAAHAGEIEDLGVRAVVTQTVMYDVDAAARLAKVVLAGSRP